MSEPSESESSRRSRLSVDRRARCACGSMLQPAGGRLCFGVLLGVVAPHRPNFFGLMNPPRRVDARAAQPGSYPDRTLLAREGRDPQSIRQSAVPHRALGLSIQPC